MLPQYGRVPSMPFPPQNPGYPVPGYVGQPVPGNWQASPPRNAPPPRMPVPAAMAAGIATPNSAPRPTIRLQAPDTLLVRPPTPVVLAAPEALGIRASTPLPAAATLDWNNAHARLQRLGALGFHLDRLAQGNVCVTFTLPAGDRRAHQIEVVADSEAAAVNAALDSAEAWASGRK
jgi:hypothetical protein